MNTPINYTAKLIKQNQGNMSMKDLEFLKANNVNVYELLEMPSDAQDGTIRKAYRKQALTYHPDKNPSPKAADKFHSISLSLKILTDKLLRNEYDNWLSSKQLEMRRSEKLDARRRKMKDDLEKAETEATFQNDLSGGQSFSWKIRSAAESKNRYGVELERLRQEGAEKRRDFEKQYLSKFEREELSSKSNKSPSSEDCTHFDSTIKIRWKIKEGISNLFTSDVLSGIMTVFGEVESAEVLPRPSGARYDTGTVKFKSRGSAVEAVSHNYTQKSPIWEGTSYRKLSSLLREAKWNKKQAKNINIGNLNKDELSLEDYMYFTLLKLREAENHNHLRRKLGV